MKFRMLCSNLRTLQVTTSYSVEWSIAETVSIITCDDSIGHSARKESFQTTSALVLQRTPICESECTLWRFQTRERESYMKLRKLWTPEAHCTTFDVATPPPATSLITGNGTRRFAAAKSAWNVASESIENVSELSMRSRAMSNVSHSSSGVLVADSGETRTVVVLSAM